METKPVETIEIPFESLEPDTLTRLIEAYVLREGTDYGLEDAVLATKVLQVRRQLQQKTARLLFLPEEETFAIVPEERRSKDAGSETITTAVVS